MSNTLILSPGLCGADGVASASRQVVRAIASTEGGADVMVLGEAAPDALPAWLSGSNTYFAAGNKARFVAELLRRSAVVRLPWRRVLAMHINVAMPALPLSLRGLPLTIFLHSWEVWGEVSPLRELTLRRASLLITNSRYTAHRFQMAHPGVLRERIKPCLLGVSDSEVVPAAAAPAHPRPFALIVGRISSEERHKGHELLLELWQAAGPELQLDLLIAGDGDDRPRLERRAQTLAVADRVRFLGRVDDATLSALYRDCAFFLMPGRDEGFGLVYVEAMRAGKPVIAGPGAPAEILEDGQSGFVIDPSQRAPLLDAIQLLARDPELRARMGDAARRRVDEHFTEAAFRRRFLRVAGYSR